MKKILISVLIVAVIVTVIIITLIKIRSQTIQMPIQVNDTQIENLDSDGYGDPDANRYNFQADTIIYDDKESVSVKDSPVTGSGILEDQKSSISYQ